MAAAAPALKTCFCRYCQQERAKAEMRSVLTSNGAKRQRCVYCSDRTKGPRYPRKPS